MKHSANILLPCPHAVMLVLLTFSAAATGAGPLSLRSAASSSNSSVAALSCLVGNNHATHSVCSSVFNASYPWDECWSCINVNFKTVKVGGCFSSRWMNPLCTDAKAACVNDGRPGSTYVTCYSADCNSCSAASARLPVPWLLVLVAALLLSLPSSLF
jgi:hypothetical protein